MFLIKFTVLGKGRRKNDISNIILESTNDVDIKKLFHV